jgi:hypothetical protein
VTTTLRFEEAKDQRIEQEFGEFDETALDQLFIKLAKDKGYAGIDFGKDKGMIYFYPISTEPLVGKTAATEKDVKTIVGLHNNTGGSTYNVILKQSLAKKDYYAVSPYPERTTKIAGKKITSQSVVGYLDRNADLLNNAKNSMGTWYNPEDGTTYLDVSIVVPTMEEAIKLGKEHNQQSIYNLKTMKEIAVDSTADKLRYKITTDPNVERGKDGAMTEPKIVSPLMSEPDIEREKLDARARRSQAEFRELTGQVKINKIDKWLNKMVSEYRALKEKFRFGRKVAKEAAKEVKEAKEIEISVLKEKAKAEVAEAKLAEEFKAQKLKDKRTIIDLGRRVKMETKALKKRIKKLARGKGMLKNYKEALNILMLGKSIDDSGLGELRALYQELKAITTTNKRLKEQTRSVKGYGIERAVQLLTKQLKTLPSRGEGKVKEYLRKEIEPWAWAGLMPSVIVSEDIDAGKERSIGYFLIDKPAADGMRKAISLDFEDLAKFSTAASELLDLKRLGKGVQVTKDLNIPYAVALHIYAARNDFGHLAAILTEGLVDEATGKQYDFTHDQLNAIFQALTEKEKRFIQNIEKEITSKVWDKANPPYERQTGKSIGKIPGWYMLQREGIPGDMSEIIADEMLYRETGRNRNITYASGKQRKSHAHGRVRANYFMNMNRIIRGTNRLAALGDTVSYLTGLLNNKDVRQLLKDKLGASRINNLENWLESVRTGVRAKTDLEYEKKMMEVSQLVTLSMISIKATISMKQFPSWFTGLGMMKPTQVVASLNALKRMAVHPFKNFDFVNDKSVLMKTRSRKGYEAVLRDFAESNDPFTWTGKDKRQRWQTALIRFVDYYPAYSIWLGMYDEGMARHGDEKRAIEEADYKVIETQPFGMTELLPPVAKGVWGRLMFIFKNQLSKNFNIVYKLARRTQNERITKGEAILRYMIAIALPSLIIGMIGRGGRPPEPEEALQDILIGSLSGSNMAMMLLFSYLTSKKYGTAGAPIVARPFFIAAAAYQDFIKGTVGAAAWKLFRIGLQRYGFPDVSSLQPLIGLYRLLTGKTQDWRELIYNEGFLRMTKPKKGKSVF